MTVGWWTLAALALLCLALLHWVEPALQLQPGPGRPRRAAPSASSSPPPRRWEPPTPVAFSPSAATTSSRGRRVAASGLS